MVKAHLPLPFFLVRSRFYDFAPQKIKKDKHPFSTNIIYGKD